MSDQLVSCLVEPRVEHSDQDTVKKLSDEGAQEIKTIIPGFISAKIPKDRIDSIRTIARVSIKPLKALRK